MLQWIYFILFYFVSKGDHGLSCGNDMPQLILSFVYIICYQIIKSHLLYGSLCRHVNKDRHAHPHAQARVHTN